MRSRRHDAPGAPDSFELDEQYAGGHLFHGNGVVCSDGGIAMIALVVRRHCDYEHDAGQRVGTDA